MKLSIALLSLSLIAAGCGGADADSSSDAPDEASSTTSEALVMHGWNHVCRVKQGFFLLHDNGTGPDGPGEYVSNGHAVYAYNLAHDNLVHVGDNVGKGHFGWIPKGNLCNGR